MLSSDSSYFHRRRFLGAVSLVAGWFLLTAHSPYRQWTVYRQVHLVIITSRDDPEGDALGDAMAAIVRDVLPDSRAAVGRGPRAERIASLLATAQAEVAIVPKALALSMFHGIDRFRDYGPIPLRVIIQGDTHLLVSRSDFIDAHAYLLAEALLKNGSGLGLSLPSKPGPNEPPPHPGVIAYSSGLPLEVPAGR
jgi:hypothetical protein